MLLCCQLPNLYSQFIGEALPSHLSFLFFLFCCLLFPSLSLPFPFLPIFKLYTDKWNQLFLFCTQASFTQFNVLKTHLCLCMRQSFVLFQCCVIFYCVIHHNLFPLTKWTLGCFWFSAITNKAAIAFLCLLVDISILFLLGIYWGIELQDHKVYLCLALVGTAKLLSKLIVSIASPTNNV